MDLESEKEILVEGELESTIKSARYEDSNKTYYSILLNSKSVSVNNVT